MKPEFFAKQSDLRKWFEKNHASKTEVLIGFHKRQSGKESITWPESVDEALCCGWIDGVRKSIDETSYTIRFTPRKSSSTWSLVNINKVEALKKAGLMRPAGLTAYENRKDHKSGMYSFEQKKPPKLDPHYERRLKKNKRAREFFNSLPPSVQKASAWWVMSAKQGVTREKRFANLVQCCEAGIKVAPLRRKGDKGT